MFYWRHRQELEMTLLVIAKIESLCSGKQTGAFNKGKSLEILIQHDDQAALLKVQGCD